MLKKKLSRRHSVWLLAGFVSACHPNFNARLTKAKVISATLGTDNWIGLSPVYIALEKGFFRQKYLDLKIKIFDSINNVKADFSAQKIDACAPVHSEAVLMASQGVDFRVVLVQDISLGADGILARNRIESLKSFAGEKIAVEPGTFSQFFLAQALKDVNLTLQNVQVIPLNPEAAAAAYEAGTVEIAVSYAPFLQQANAKQKDGRIIYDSSQSPGSIVDLYAFQPHFIQQYPEIVEAFVAGVLEGVNYLKDNPKESIEIVAPKLKISPQELAANLKRLKFPDTQMNLDMLTNPNSKLSLLNKFSELANFFLSQKLISKIPNVSNLIEPRFVKNMSEK